MVLGGGFALDIGGVALGVRRGDERYGDGLPAGVGVAADGQGVLRSIVGGILGHGRGRARVLACGVPGGPVEVALRGHEAGGCAGYVGDVGGALIRGRVVG